MNRFLPSKKLLVFLGIALVILGCFILFFKFKDRKTIYFLNNTNQEEIANEISQQTLKNDTDGDGLKDWEEILWKTDPQNPDTDGDETNDNLEILAKRDPLIPGPNDLLKNTVTSEIENNNSEYNKPLTQTDILSRELFAGYVALKQNNQLGTVQEEQFINSLVGKNLSLDINSTKKYSLDDLNIIQDDSQETLQQYATKIDLILSPDVELEHDIIIAKNALDLKSQEELEKIDLNIKVYENIQKQLISIPIPYKLSALHINTTNTFANLISDATKIKSILNDPITGLIGIKSYIENQEIFGKEWEEIGLYLFERGIKFN